MLQWQLAVSLQAHDGHVYAGGELAAAHAAVPAQPSRRINLCTAINNALHIALAADPKCVLLRFKGCDAVLLFVPHDHSLTVGAFRLCLCPVWFCVYTTDRLP